MSSQGRYVVFVATDTRVGYQKWTMYLRDRRRNANTVVARVVEAEPLGGVHVSTGSRYVAYATLTQGAGDAYRFDRVTGARIRLGLGATIPHDRGTVDAMTPDGRFLVVSAVSYDGSGPCSHVTVVVRDIVERRTLPVVPTTCVSPERASGGDLSARGRYATLASGRGGLVPGETNGVMDVFRRDLRTGAIVRLSVAADGGQLGEASSGGSMSARARALAFTTRSAAGPADTNGVMAVYLRAPSRWAPARRPSAGGGYVALRPGPRPCRATPTASWTSTGAGRFRRRTCRPHPQPRRRRRNARGVTVVVVGAVAALDAFIGDNGPRRRRRRPAGHRPAGHDLLAIDPLAVALAGAALFAL